jgi:hypothetical protein
MKIHLKVKNRYVKQVLFGSGKQWEGEEKRVKEGE